MTTRIDFDEYHIREGEIVTFTRPVKTYTSPAVDGVGAQVFGERGEPFEIMLRKYGPASFIESLKRQARDKQGRIVLLSSDGVIYNWPSAGGYRFLVERVEIESAKVVPFACGVDSRGSYSYSPAARVVSKWTMRAVR